MKALSNPNRFELFMEISRKNQNSYEEEERILASIKETEKAYQEKDIKSEKVEEFIDTLDKI